MNQAEFDRAMADIFEPPQEKQSEAFDEIFDQQLDALEAHCESEDENEEILRPLVREMYPNYDPISSKENNIFSSQSSEDQSEAEIITQNEAILSPEAGKLINEIVAPTESIFTNSDDIILELENLIKEVNNSEKKTLPAKIKKKKQKRVIQGTVTKLSNRQMENLRPAFKRMTELVFEPLFKNIISTTVDKMMEFREDEHGKILLNLEFLQQELNKVIGKPKTGRPRTKLQPQIVG